MCIRTFFGTSNTCCPFFSPAPYSLQRYLEPDLTLLASQLLHRLKSSSGIVKNIILVLVEGSKLHAGRLVYNELPVGLGHLLCNVH